MSTDVMIAFAAVGSLCASALAVGDLLRLPVPESLDGSERLTLRWLTGAGAIGTVLFLIGLVRFRIEVVAITLIIPVVFVAPRWFHSRLSFRRRLFAHWIDVFTVAIVVFIAVSSLALPAGTSDDISYHLLGPKDWLEAGRVTPLLHVMQTAFPAVIEMLYAAVVAVGNFRAPGLLSVAFLLALMVQVRGFVRRLGVPQPYQSLAMLLIASSPVVSDRVGVAFVDVAFAAFILGAIRVLLDGPLSSGAAVTGGSLCGLACGTKYTGLVCTAAVIGLVLVDAVGRRSSKSIRYAALAAAAALMIAAPWYTRNLLILGSPIYPPPPLLTEWFTVQAMPPESIDVFHHYILDWNGKGEEKGVFDFILLPLRLTFDSASFGAWNGAYGPALLAFVPIGLITLRREALVRRLALVSLLILAGWFLTQQESRFVVHLVALATVLVVAGIAWCSRSLPLIGRTLTAVTVLVAVGTGSRIVIAQHSVRFSQVLEARTDLQDRAGSHAKAFDWLNQTQSVQSVLLIDRCVKPFYLEKPYIMIRGEYGEQPHERVPNVTAALTQRGDLRWTHILDVRCNNKALDEVLPTDAAVTPVFADLDATIYVSRTDAQF